MLFTSYFPNITTAKEDNDDKSELSWDNFDYSDVPKVDPRFKPSSSSTGTSIESIHQCVSSTE